MTPLQRELLLKLTTLHKVRIQHHFFRDVPHKFCYSALSGWNLISGFRIYTVKECFQYITTFYVESLQLQNKMKIRVHSNTCTYKYSKQPQSHKSCTTSQHMVHLHATTTLGIRNISLECHNKAQCSCTNLVRKRTCVWHDMHQSWLLNALDSTGFVKRRFYSSSCPFVLVKRTLEWGLWAIWA